MFRRNVLTLAAGLVVLLATAADVHAQWGPGQQGPLWNYRVESRSSPVFVAPAAPVAPVTSQSFFNSPDQNRSVLIQLRVPDNAQVYFGDSATSQTGADRRYVSPALTPGQFYVYDIRVRWNESGQPRERSQRVTVQAGDRINLNLGSAESR
jgi:uncharacterized protein (TIGR03000 family)